MHDVFSPVILTFICLLQVTDSQPSVSGCFSTLLLLYFILLKLNVVHGATLITNLSTLGICMVQSSIFDPDVLHTVGPMDDNEQKLRSCYTRCLQLTLENEIRSLVRRSLT